MKVTSSLLFGFPLSIITLLFIKPTAQSNVENLRDREVKAGVRVDEKKAESDEISAVRRAKGDKSSSSYTRKRSGERWRPRLPLANTKGDAEGKCCRLPLPTEEDVTFIN